MQVKSILHISISSISTVLQKINISINFYADGRYDNTLNKRVEQGGMIFSSSTCHDPLTAFNYHINYTF